MGTEKDGRTNGHKEADIHFSKCFEGAYKWGFKKHDSNFVTGLTWRKKGQAVTCSQREDTLSCIKMWNFLINGATITL
jgi:hypothetical protein